MFGHHRSQAKNLTLILRIPSFWKFVKQANGYYKLYPQNSTTGKVLDIYQGSNTDGAKVEIFDAIANASSQEFKLQYNSGNGTFTILTHCSNDTKCLDVQSGATTSGTNIIQYTSKGSANQQWVIEPVNSAAGQTIQSTATYTSNGNYLSTVTDPSGNKVTYGYDQTKGVLNSVTDPNGKATTNTYDPATDDLKKVSKTNSDGVVYENNYTYENDNIKTVSNGSGTTYTFGYDAFGNNSTVAVGTQNLITNTFNAGTGLLDKATYGNGQYIQNKYDSLDRLTDKYYGTTLRYEYAYDADGNLGVYKDNINNCEYRYYYDLAERLSSINGNNGHSASYIYDKNNNLTKQTQKLNNTTYTNNYTYDIDDRIKDITTTAVDKITMAYDTLGRTSSKTYTSNGKSYAVSYEFEPGSGTNATTTRVKTVNYPNGKKLNYTYDKNGNISTITDQTGKVLQYYYYDDLNQLIKNIDVEQQKTFIYHYDAGGNITSKEQRVYDPAAGTTSDQIEKTYTYAYGDTNWKDKLTSYDGKAITYDAIGNPLTYDGWAYTWEEGRQLATMTKGSTAISFKYNDQGLRTQKTVNGTTTKYYYEGDDVVWEANGTDTIHYTYDNNGMPLSMKLNGVSYYYVYNVQGDVIALLDSNMAEVVTYKYDAWGRIVSSTDTSGVGLAAKNPYRYRGYRYDNETGMYYLQSRYYTPEWGRFLNADETDVLAEDQDHLIENNLFAYCLNNPVNMVDDSGEIAWFIAAAVGGAIFDSAMYLWETRHGGFSWRGLGKAAAVGALTGVCFGAIGRVAKVVKIAAKASKIAKARKPIYSSRVLQRMAQDRYHRFPASFEKSILSRRPLRRANGLREYLQRGYANGKEGVYHITLSNNGRVIRHRAFIPKSDWKRYSKRWGLPSINKIKW